MEGAWLGQQIDALVEEVPHLAMQPRGVARALWVDDNPANNEYERSLLRGDGIVFDNVVELLRAYLRAGLIPYRLGLQQGDLLPAMDAPWRRVLSEMQRIFDHSGCMASSRYEPLWEGPPDDLLERGREECLCLQ